jgi:hypothetical protein
MNNYSAFIQDTWSVSKKLTLSLGLRFSSQNGTIPVQNEAAPEKMFLGVSYNQSVKEAFTPLKWTTVSPRLGLIYDITGDGKTLFKVSYSRYDQANLIINFMLANPNQPLSYLILLMPDGTPIPGAYLSVTYPQGAKIGYKDHPVKAPYLDEFTISLEREIIEDLSLGVKYIKKLDRNLIHDMDANSLDGNKLMNEGELVWTNWEKTYFTDPYDGSQQYAWNKLDVSLPNDFYLVNPPGADRDYDGAQITLNKRYSHGWSLVSSYVWSYSRGLIGTDFSATQPAGMVDLYADPNYHINAIGRFPLERRHMFQLYGYFEGPFGLNCGGNFRLMSGERYTRSLNTLNAGVMLNQAQAVIYAEKKGSMGYPTQINLDLRLEKAFRLGGKTSIKVFVDGFNILNSNKAIQVETESDNPAKKFKQVLAIQSPRALRIGAKFEF